jgi:hypothetical protein
MIIPATIWYFREIAVLASDLLFLLRSSKKIFLCIVLERGTKNNAAPGKWFTGESLNWSIVYN